MVPAQPDGITFQWEKLPAIAAELLPLLKLHWEEIEDHKDILPLEPAWELMFSYEIANVLRCFTIRSDGLLVGYIFVMFPPSLHYSVGMAWVERFWLRPEFRRGWLGIHLFKAAESLARDAGAKLIHIPFRLHFQRERGTLSKIFSRMGYTLSEAVYVKVL